MVQSYGEVDDGKESNYFLRNCFCQLFATVNRDLELHVFFHASHYAILGVDVLLCILTNAGWCSL